MGRGPVQQAARSETGFHRRIDRGFQSRNDQTNKRIAADTRSMGLATGLFRPDYTQRIDAPQCAPVYSKQSGKMGSGTGIPLVAGSKNPGYR